MSKDYKVGDVIHFAQPEFDRAVNQFNAWLPWANTFIQELEVMIKRKLTTKDFIGLLTNSYGIEDFTKEYLQVLKQELTGLTGELLADSIQQRVLKTFVKLEQKKASLMNAYSQYLSGTSPGMQIHDVVLIDGVATYDIEKIRDRFTTKITNKKQKEINTKLATLKTLSDEINADIRETGCRLSMYSNDGSGFIEIQDDGTIIVDPLAIAMIKEFEMVGAMA